MRIYTLRIQNIRNHKVFSCEFGERTTLVHGNNGAGKTSLLESIYIAYRGTSFKGLDKDIVKQQSNWYRIDTSDDSGFTRTASFDNRDEKSRKSFTIDDKKSIRLPTKYKRPLVLFTPNDLRLIDGSPVRRRDYLDTVISQINPHYGAMLRRYERALQQRNKLLKVPGILPDQFFSWNIMLSETGAYIINTRIEYVATIQNQINRHYQSIASSSDHVEAIYTHAPTTPAKLLYQYEQSFERDRLIGNTSVGPHRHDIEIMLRGRPADDTASRGEMRTIVVALKYIEAEAVSDTFQEYPLVLLDDVYGELDMERRRNLAQTLHDYQIIITSTDKISGLPSGTKRIQL